jgi:hypothetical protein
MSNNLSDLGRLSSVDLGAKRKVGKVPRRQLKAMICYQLPEVQQMLKIVAAEQNKTQQALLAEGLNAVFLKYGKPAIAS